MSYIFFNPNYQLRQDGNRVILYGDESDAYQSEDWFSFIHPFHAMMFSFFKGQKEYEHEIQDFAHYFSLSYDDAVAIVKGYTANERKDVYSNGNFYFFPKNVLLESDVPLELDANNYEISDFHVDGEPDLKSLRTHLPVSVNLELTMKCYVDCCYCYANRTIQKNGQMSTQEIISLIKNAKSLGVLNFDINGGEVLMHPGIYDIVSTLHKCGYKPLISTKKPVTYSELKKLKSCGVSKFQISLDSVNEEILEHTIKVRPGYIQAITKTLLDANSLQFKIGINVVLTKYNCKPDIIWELFDFLNQFSCIDMVRLNVCGFSIYKGAANYYRIRPSQDSVDVIEHLIQSSLCGKYAFKIGMSGYDKRCQFESLQGKNDAFKQRAICTGNLRNLVILPNGDVTICEELYDNPHFIIGNVLDSSLEDIWNGEKALKLFYSPCDEKSNSICHDCKVYTTCRSRVGVCWKSVLMAYGEENWDFPDPRCPKAPSPFNEIYIK